MYSPVAVNLFVLKFFFGNANFNLADDFVAQKQILDFYMFLYIWCKLWFNCNKCDTS